MPELEKVPIHRILSLEGDERFPAVEFIIHQITIMAKDVTILHTYCHFSKAVWTHGYMYNYMNMCVNIYACAYILNLCYGSMSVAP